MFATAGLSLLNPIVVLLAVATAPSCVEPEVG